jgi:ATP adenylyltransferase
MDHLWAPWRMTFIGSEPEPGCLFCRVLGEPARDLENLVIARPPGALLMMNRYPYNSGHLMIAPVRHTGDLAELPAGEAAELMAAVQQALALLQRVLSPDGFNLGANLGRTAGAGIPDHLHFHAVPRWAGDTNFMPVIGETKVVNEHLEATAAKLREGIAAG